MQTNVVSCETLRRKLLTGLPILARHQLTRADLQSSEDRELVSLSLGGNAQAYEVLVRRYQKLVYNVLFQMLQNHEAAADVTQDTFIRAYKALGTFRLESPFKPWLLRIATNAGLNTIRNGKNKAHDSLDAALEDGAQCEPASDQNVELEVEWRLSQAMLQEALNQLPARHRHIFLLRYQHDLSYAEIAQITEESETAIKSLLFRTREKLRRMLQTDLQQANRG